MFRSCSDGLLLHHWRQLLVSREPSCSGCGRRRRAEGRSGSEQQLLAEMRKDELREICKAADLRAKVADGKAWRTMPELREALLAHLSPAAEQAGICLIVCRMVNMRKWNEKVTSTKCFSHCNDNTLHQNDDRLSMATNQ